MYFLFFIFIRKLKCESKSNNLNELCAFVAARCQYWLANQVSRVTCVCVRACDSATAGSLNSLSDFSGCMCVCLFFEDIRNNFTDVVKTDLIFEMWLKAKRHHVSKIRIWTSCSGIGRLSWQCPFLTRIVSSQYPWGDRAEAELFGHTCPKPLERSRGRDGSENSLCSGVMAAQTGSVQPVIYSDQAGSIINSDCLFLHSFSAPCVIAISFLLK